MLQNYYTVSAYTISTWCQRTVADSFRNSVIANRQFPVNTRRLQFVGSLVKWEEELDQRKVCRENTNLNTFPELCIHVLDSITNCEISYLYI